MAKFIIRRVVFAIISIFVIVSATFFLMKAIPGDPITSENDEVPPEVLEAMKEHYGLNDPIMEQYGNYLISVAKWDLGPSYKYKGTTVNEIINSSFPVSLVLGLSSLFIAIAFGLILGVLAALHHNKSTDYISMVVAVIGISIPNFVVGALLQYVFAQKLGWFPLARWGTFSHVVLPSLAIAALPMAFIARLTRSNMLEVLSTNYIKTARAKGVKKWLVTYKHALRNALLPVITFLGPMAVGILTGTFVIEQIFGIPGLGRHFITSITNRDYTVIMGTTVFYSVILIVVVLIIDISYGFIDPRIKLTSGKED
ncbi:MAG TPA: ABC transporter permease [Virgibacillus sp.]|nr:ABC transporter permease [Virgibacillus sp.]